MSILPALALTGFGGFGAGLYVGAMCLRPNVGPWRIRSEPAPATSAPHRPAVHVAVTTPPAAAPVTPTVATGHLDPAVRDALAQYALTQFAQLPQGRSNHE